MDLQRRITAQALVLLGLLLAPQARADECVELQRLQAATREVEDTRHERSAVSPWLRRSPFLAAELRRAVLADEGSRSAQARGDTAVAVILAAMAELDAQAASIEHGAELATGARARACRDAEIRALLGDPRRLRRLATEPLAPLYRAWPARIGAYAVARPFLRAGSARWRATEVAAIELGTPAAELLQRPRHRAGADAAERAGILAGLRASHPLGWPVPDDAALERLVPAFAPELATHADVRAARIGSLTGAGGVPVVDPARPRGYLRHTLVRWGTHVLLQLEFTFWFTERPKTGPFDPYGGAVDGLVLRVTIGDDGRALVWESIHPCGCYYALVLPADRPLHFVAADPAVQEAPLLLDGPGAGDRLRVHYTPDTHYLRAAVAAAGSDAADVRIADYDLVPYAALLARGPARPPFDGKGLLRGTERGERLFLWPSGIASPGAMRSSGRQATAFLGRRRFDAAELADGRLRTRASETAPTWGTDRRPARNERD